VTGSRMTGSRIIPNKQHALRFTLYALAVLTLLALAVWWLYRPTDDTLAEIQRRGVLRVGLDASFPPFETLDADGQIIGLDVDIGRAIAADLGVKAEFVNIGFDGLYDALLAHRVDLILSGLPYDPRLTQDVAYSRHYFNAGQMLVVRKDDNRINAVKDLAGHVIAVEWGSQADMEARRLAQDVTGLTLLRRDSAADALDALFNDQADAAIVDAVSGARAFPRGLKIITYVSDDWYVAAVDIDSPTLLEAVNQALLGLEQSGDMAKMQAHWLHGK
jgi:ABC-type amino acid transport substrate-binding protein